MKIFKFGGASVKDADGVENMASIVKNYSEELVIVISAMGKTTNALELVVRDYFNQDFNGMAQSIEQLKQYHFGIIDPLFQNHKDEIVSEIGSVFKKLEKHLRRNPSLDYDFEYDQIVSIGEILSTKIVSAYLNQIGLINQWIDIRFGLRTDAVWREGSIDWKLSEGLIQSQFRFPDHRIYLTQGFIGATVTNQTTTLGREGSDYTAAILANILNAESVTIWKDVPGIMNADPNKFEETVKMDKLSYREAVELTFYGAKVIHPKTMKPLVEKNIPLYVRSFLKPQDAGSVICNIDHPMNYMPVIITKENQILITISPNDFSFMAEESIGDIYQLFAKYRIRVNLVQQSAMNFSVAIDQPERGFESLIDDLKQTFVVHFNKGLELLTIRYYNEAIIEKMTVERTVFVAQKTRTTLRFLLK